MDIQTIETYCLLIERFLFMVNSSSQNIVNQNTLSVLNRIMRFTFTNSRLIVQPTVEGKLELLIDDIQTVDNLGLIGIAHINQMFEQQIQMQAWAKAAIEHVSEHKNDRPDYMDYLDYINQVDDVDGTNPIVSEPEVELENEHIEKAVVATLTDQLRVMQNENGFFFNQIFIDDYDKENKILKAIEWNKDYINSLNDPETHNLIEQLKNSNGDLRVLFGNHFERVKLGDTVINNILDHRIGMDIIDVSIEEQNNPSSLSTSFLYNKNDKPCLSLLDVMMLHRYEHDKDFIFYENRKDLSVFNIAEQKQEALLVLLNDIYGPDDNVADIHKNGAMRFLIQHNVNWETVSQREAMQHYFKNSPHDDNLVALLNSLSEMDPNSKECKHQQHCLHLEMHYFTHMSVRDAIEYNTKVQMYLLDKYDDNGLLHSNNADKEPNIFNEWRNQDLLLTEPHMMLKDAQNGLSSTVLRLENTIRIPLLNVLITPQANQYPFSFGLAYRHDTISTRKPLTDLERPYSEKSDAVVAHEWRDEHKPVQLVWSDDSTRLINFFDKSWMYDDNLAIILNNDRVNANTPSP